MPTGRSEQEQSFSAVRAICIGSVLLVVGAFWIVVQELLLNAGSLSSSSPPVGAVGLFLALLSIILLLQLIRTRWCLGRKELLIIYCMLVTFFPLASQGMWQRFVGIIVNVRTFWAYKAPMPDHMIPRGPELVQNNSFAYGMKGWTGQAKPHQFEEDGLKITCVVLKNDNKDDISQIKQWIPRKAEDGTDRFIPGQKFVLLARLRRSDFVQGTYFTGNISLDGERWLTLQHPGLGPFSLGHTTSSWMGYTRIGFDDLRHLGFEIPYGADEGFWMRWRLSGRGKVEVSRVSLFSNEPVYQLLEGSSEIGLEHRDRIPRDERGRLNYRPKGNLSGVSHLYDLRGYVPWAAWAKPLASWGLLWAAMFGTMFALAAILFRQWSDREKLTFPLTVFPLLFTEPDKDRQHYVPRILRSRALWAGLITALIVYGINGCHFYNADFPHLPLKVNLEALFERPPWTALVADRNPVILRIVLLGIGVAFFMDLQMAFNLWFFYLVCKLWFLIPFYQGKLRDPVWKGGPDYAEGLMHLQGIGAAIGIVLIAIWLGRRQLLVVFRKALIGDRSIDDSAEPMPYRMAVGLLVVSFVLLGIWGEVSGAGWLFGVFGMGLMLVFAVMASRVRAECAVPGMWLVPAMPVLLLISLGSIFRFGMLPMTYFVLAGSFMCVGYFLMLMPAIMESFQIARIAGIRRKTLGAALVIGFVVAMTSGGYILLDWGYARGLSTMRGSLKDEKVLWRWRIENFHARTAIKRREELQGEIDADRQLSETSAKEMAELKALPTVKPAAKLVGIGAGITCALAGARLMLMRFPFHPIGYAMAGTQLMSYFWFSILIAWLIRLIGLRLGGVRLIRNQLQPYMIGLIVGSVGAVLIWDVVGILKIAGGYTGQIYAIW